MLEEGWREDVGREGGCWGSGGVECVGGRRVGVGEGGCWEGGVGCWGKEGGCWGGRELGCWEGVCCEGRREGR